MVSDSSVAFSAPGKALLLGGYLVLDPAYIAWSVALDARIYARASPVPSKDSPSLVVRSPQFKDSLWRYTCEATSCVKSVKLSASPDNATKNPFVEAALTVVINYAGLPATSVDIDIFSDPAFHSSASGKIVNTKKFLYHDLSIDKVPKTGLGSSAALTTALVGTLLAVLLGENVKSQASWLDIVHKLAQIAHSIAQSKIGSGFDVASATFGSILYRRFPKDTIAKACNPNDSDFASTLASVVGSTWDMSVKPCRLPRGLRLVMGDITSGSETPKLVKLVLDWRNNCPNEASKIWNELDSYNSQIINALQKLSELSNSLQDYDLQMESLENKVIGCSPSTAERSDVAVVHKVIYDIGHLFDKVRVQLRLMTDKTTAPIEPPSQTRLLDLCNKIPGVIGSVVPGAGGYDAICLLVISSAFEDIKRHFKDKDLSRLHLLDVREEDVGLRVENPFELPACD